MFHIASVIRFWERTSFTRKHSADLNVGGTENIIKMLKSMPGTSEKILVYCSTAGLDIPRANFARLWFSGAGFKNSYYKTHRISDETPCLPDERLRSWYTITKGLADDAVRASHGSMGIKAGCVSILFGSKLLITLVVLQRVAAPRDGNPWT